MRNIVIGIVFTVWFILRSSLIIDPVIFLQARQMLAFPIGLYLGQHRSEKTHHPVLAIFMILAGTAVYGILHMPIGDQFIVFLYNLCALFTCVPVAIGVIILCQSGWFYSKTVTMIGILSFEIYLIHGIFLDNMQGVQGLAYGLLLTTFLSIGLHYVSYLLAKGFAIGGYNGNFNGFNSNKR